MRFCSKRHLVANSFVKATWKKKLIQSNNCGIRNDDNAEVIPQTDMIQISFTESFAI